MTDVDHLKEENEHYLKMIAKLRDGNVKLKLKIDKKDHLLKSYREAQQSNLEIYNSLMEVNEELKEKYELLLADYGNLDVDYDALKRANVVEESKSSSFDKEFILDVPVEVVETRRQITQVFTRFRRRTLPVDVPNCCYFCYC